VETDAGRVVTAARVETDGTDRLTVVSGRLARPLGAGELKRPVGARRLDPLGLVIVLGLKDGIVGVVVIVDPRKLLGRAYRAE